MAVIGKIREKSTLLLITIGGAIVLFVLGDIATSGGSVFKSNQNVIGEVDGESIDRGDFEARYQEALENYKKNYGQGNVDAATSEAIRNQAWDQMITEKILQTERDELGLTVTGDELFDLVQGSNPDPSVVQAFSDPNTGQFDPSRVAAFLQNMENDEEAKKSWIAFEQDLKKRRLGNKYLLLIKKGLYVTSVEAENDYKASNKRVDIRYVAKQYFSLPDSAVKVTDADIKKYYNENKEQYKRDVETREIEFVTFDVKPSDEDIQEVKDWINKVTKEYETITDDSVYVNEKTDIGKEYFQVWRTKESLEDGLDTALFNAEVGTVHGPYRVGDTYKVAKLLGTKMAPDSVKASHILLQPTKQSDTEETLKAEIDSLQQLIKSGKATFEELAMRHSKDQDNADKGGDLGWFAEGMMVKPFNDAAFSTKKGDMTVVTTRFGVHLLKVTDVKPKVKKVDIGVIQREIKPSSKTYQNYYTEAEKFARENNTAEKFENAVVEQGLNKRISPPLEILESRIPGLEEPRDVVKWAYEAEKGDVSKAFDLTDKFVVAVLTKVSPEGYASIEEIKPELEAEARKEKKAEKFVAEFDEALKSNPSIDALGTAVNTGVAVAQNVTFFQGNIPGLGREPELAGTVVYMNVGEMTKPIVGNTGVFVAVVDNVYEAPQATDLSSNKSRLGGMLSNRANEAIEVLKDKSGVVDNRSKFY